MKLIFVQWPTTEYQSIVLTLEGANERLISFAFLQHVVPDDYLPELVTQGWVDHDRYRRVTLRKKKT